MSKFKPGDKVVLKKNYVFDNKKVGSSFTLVGHLPYAGEILTIEEVGLSISKTGIFLSTCKLFGKPFQSKIGLHEGAFELYLEPIDDPIIKEDIARLLNEATELIRLY